MRPSGTLLAPALTVLLLAPACSGTGKPDPRPLPALAGWWRMEAKRKDAVVPNIAFLLRPDGALDFYRDDGGGTNFSSRFSGTWMASSPAPGQFEIRFDFTDAEPRHRCLALPGECSEYKLPLRETWSFTEVRPGTMETPGAVWWRSEAPLDVAAVAPGSGSPASGGDRADVTRPASPAPVNPASTGGPSPDAIVDPVKEPVASGEPAPLGAPVPPVAVNEPITLAPARTEAAPPAGRFAIYFFSVRPADRVSSEWRRLTKRYPDLARLELRPTRPVDVPGKGTFYGIVAGSFTTRAEAQAVCDRLHSQDQACRVLVP